MTLPTIHQPTQVGHIYEYLVVLVLIPRHRYNHLLYGDDWVAFARGARWVVICTCQLLCALMNDIKVKNKKTKKRRFSVAR